MVAAPVVYHAETHACLLKSAAEVVAKSMGTSCGMTEEDHVTMLMLKDLLLAESEDAGDDVALRVKQLRNDFASAVQLSLCEYPDLKRQLVDGFVAPKSVRVAVRGTGGRHISTNAFTVGRNSYCDVEIFGDSVVAPLHGVVVALPGGILVIDAWSEGGARLLPPDHELVFVQTHCERVNFQISTKSFFAVGPRTSKLYMDVQAAMHMQVSQDPTAADMQVLDNLRKDEHMDVKADEVSSKGCKTCTSNASTDYMWRESEGSAASTRLNDSSSFSRLFSSSLSLSSPDKACGQQRRMSFGEGDQLAKRRRTDSRPMFYC